MKVMNIPMQFIKEDTEQPRYTFDDESINELAESIKKMGLLNPIKVRPIEDGYYKIVFGNRRYKACKLLEFKEIPAIISEQESELDIYLEQLTENIQREDFTPIEEAEAFYKLANDPKFNQTSQFIATTLGKSEQYINKKLALLSFGKEVQKIIHKGKNIVPNKLSEEQVLPLKDVSIEYRDYLAIKIARGKVDVLSVKKIAELFLDKQVNSESKELLIKKTPDELLDDWVEYKRQKNMQTKNVKLTAINTPQEVDEFRKINSMMIRSDVAIIKELEQLLIAIPSRHEIPDEILGTIDNIKIEDKAEFLNTIEMLIDRLMGHVHQWEDAKNILNKKRISIVKKSKDNPTFRR